jgi:ribonucleoside-diphosphate reductase alpha chain
VTIADSIWSMKYKFGDEKTVAETMTRVAKAASENDPEAGRAFHEILTKLWFLPGGRIIGGAGTGRNVTLLNCYVMDTIGDDMRSIFRNVSEAGLTMQAGGGIGHDFSTLRPLGAPVLGVGADASGPVSFMDMWDAMCKTIMSAGSRRGAMMGTLRCDHPDIELFVEAKSDPTRLRNFNLSVLVTDLFMAAVENDSEWPLKFNGKVYKTLRARDLWEKIMRATYDYAEPGVIFIDRVNSDNNLGYIETIAASNPCGEQMLPPYGACLLGSVNLTAMVDNPFTSEARINRDRLDYVTRTGVRFLDNIIDVSMYPLPKQAEEARNKRRMGLGVTGLANMLMMLGVAYSSDRGRAIAGEVMRFIRDSAYKASTDLAKERGAFPVFNLKEYLERPFIALLPSDIRAAIRANGMRNGLLLTVAPTGTISLLAGNISSGIEPVFAHTYTRNVRQPDGQIITEPVEDFAVKLWRAKHPEGDLPQHFETALNISPMDHLRMQAVIQRHVDASISKTVNCPEAISFEEFKGLYREGWSMGLKGCTTYRPNPVTGAVLATRPACTEDDDETEALEPSSDLTTPLPRDAVLAGFTYKLKWPDSAHSLYVTINDTFIDGQRRPFEIFINSKNLEHFAWTLALTRMISAVFRRGGDVRFVVDELKAVFDPRGGAWVGGEYVPSLLAALGKIIEQHFEHIGLD